MKNAIRSLIRLLNSIFILNIIIIIIISAKKREPNPLDYTLYSQLLKEFENEYDTLGPALNIANYYNLNNQTLQKYNEYLHFPESERIRLKNMTKDMFEFAYDSYMAHAFPQDELDPIHCSGRGPDQENPANININDALGDYMLTLVDSLSSLVIFGNETEFKRASKLVIENLNFEKDNTVQVFEATIRVMGGLISAHLLATDKKQPFGNMNLPNYDNELLNLAHDLGVRLLMAFENKNTPLPYPRVNLKRGVPQTFLNNTCTSGAGTLLLEFGMLGVLLNDPIYEQVARKAMRSIFDKRSNQTGLLGNELNVNTGEWTGVMSGLGAGVDSYFEYLLKVLI